MGAFECLLLMMFAHLLVAVLFYDLSLQQPQIGTLARLMSVCSVMFALAKLDLAIGVLFPAAESLTERWFITFATMTDLLYFSAIALPLVSFEGLLLANVGGALALLAIIPVREPVIQTALDSADMTAIFAVAATVAAQFGTNNPTAKRLLMAAAAAWVVPQAFFEQYKHNDFYLFYLGAAGVVFSMALYHVLSTSNAATATEPVPSAAQAA